MAAWFVLTGGNEVGARAKSTAEALRIFATGRVAWIVFGLLFQLATVRVLPLSEYVVFATASAVVLILQWALSFSLPRLLARVGAGYVANNDDAGLGAFLRRLVLIRLTIVVVAVVILGALATLFRESLPPEASAALLVAGGAWGIALTLFSDAEAAGQLLMQQRLARLVVGIEPAVRTIGLLVLAALVPNLAALDVVILSAATTAIAAGAFAAGVFSWHRAGAALLRGQPRPAPPPFRELLRLSLAGQASALGSLFVSPGAVRLVASASLTAEVYAAFAFVQGLVVSAIRFTPSLMLTAAIEPMVMTDLARTNLPSRLEAVLGLIFKIEVLFWAPVITGLIAGGPAALDILSGGQFAGYDLLLPSLLPILLLYGLYRSFETAALALGVVGRLNLTVVVGAVALVLLLVTAPLGIVAIILVPHLEVLARIAVVGHGLARLGIRRIIDLKVGGLAALAILLFGFGARWILQNQATVLVVIGGTLAALACFAAIVLMRPLRSAEAQLLQNSRLGALGRRLSRQR